MPNDNEATSRRPWFARSGIVAIAIVLVAAVALAGVLLFDRGETENNAENDRRGGGHANAETLRRPGSNTVLEASDNKVTVVEFLDYQCPACAGYYLNITKKLEEDYAGRITFVTRNFPLDMHPLAVPAAKAAEAAAEQGKYREYYHALYDSYQSWAANEDGTRVGDDRKKAREHFDEIATEIGLDLDRFHRDMESKEVRQRIERDQADGRKLGVSGTPTIFVNGEQFTPEGETFPEVDEQLRSMIDEELDR